MNFLVRVFNAGVGGKTFEEGNDIRLMNQIAFSGAFFSGVLSLIMLFSGWNEYLLLNVLTILLCLAIVYANYLQQYFAAAVIFACILPVVMVAYIFLFGNIGAENYLFIGSLVGMYFLRGRRVAGMVTFVICGIGYMASKLLLWLYHGEITLTTTTALIFMLNSAFTFFIIYFVTFLFKDSQEKERKKITDISESRGRLLSLLAHDLRNPIRNLEILTSAAAKDQYDEAEYRKVMLMMTQQLSRTGLALENTLLWVRKQMNGIQLQYEKFTLKSVVEEVITLFSETIREKGVVVEVSISEGLLVHSDREILQVIFRNLISNAIKHSFPNRGIIQISAEEAGTTIWINISDNGQGMSRDKLSTLFTGQPSTPGTRNEKGYGIGLMLVKDFLDQLDEKIAVKSKPNEGTTFSFSIQKG